MSYKLQAIIFDFDGTITEGLSHHDAAYSQVLQSIGLRIPLNDLRQHVGKTVPEVYRAILVTLGDPNHDIQTLVKLHEEYVYAGYSINAEAAPGISSVMQQAATMGLQMAVASSTHSRVLNTCLEKFGLKQYISAVIGGEQISKGKPDPEMIQKALHQLGVEGHMALAIDDLPRGIEAAKKLDMFTINYTFYSGLVDSTANLSINSYDDLDLAKLLL